MKEEKISSLTSPFWISVEKLHTLIRTSGYQYALRGDDAKERITLKLYPRTKYEHNETNLRVIDVEQRAHVIKIGNHLGYEQPRFIFPRVASAFGLVSVIAVWHTYPLMVSFDWIPADLTYTYVSANEIQEYPIETSSGIMLGF